MKTTTSSAFALAALTLTALSRQQPPHQGGSNHTPPGVLPRPQSGGLGVPGGQSQPPRSGGGAPFPFELPEEIPSFDGSGNNVAALAHGVAATVFRRVAPAAYGDGISSPAGSTRPSARAISNALAARPADAKPNRRGATDYLCAWGQFIDHDLDETPTAVPEEAFNIAVPTGDAQFDPASTGTATIGLNRSNHELVAGVRQQNNALSHYIDGSMIYGSDEARATALRALDGTGHMKTSGSANGPLLPLNTGGVDNFPPGPQFFVAGDIRVNEQPALTALQTLFVREHNHGADRYSAQNPEADDNEIFHFARSMVAAELQSITYREYLPLLLGHGAIPKYKGYQVGVDATVSNEFATAAYRFGHSTVSSTVLRLGPDGQEAPEGHLSLLESFFNTTGISEHGIDSVLRGLAGQPCEELDSFIVDDLRNFLFGPPGAGGLDLAALNIQRGRDHGLPSFNAMRQALGLRPALTFAQVNPHPAVVANLTAAYPSTADMDLWIVGLAEKDRHGSMLGETLHRIIVDQFRRTRDGDRFWYLNQFSKELIKMIDQQSLATIIRRNTNIKAELPNNVWIVRRPPPAPRKAR